MDLNTLWYLLIGLVITVYAILDGYDLGVGLLHLSTRDEGERRVNLNSIGPLWDGNEVWLIAGGGTLFAVFPVVYSALLSAFYILFSLLLISLIFRAISIEFRNKSASHGWQRLWDICFGFGSISASLFFGIMLGNILLGLPVNEEQIITGQPVSLFNLYAIFTGLITVTLFTLHGAVYMTLKADEVYLHRIKRYVLIAWFAFIILYPAGVAVTFYKSPIMFHALLSSPLSIPLGIINIGSIIYIPYAIKAGRHGRAFTASSLLIASIMGFIGLSLFPAIVPSSINPLYSLTAYNASAGPYTLKVMQTIFLTVLPFIIGYTVFINMVFKGKAGIHEEGYSDAEKL
ncbi:MAG: cytochrome d ubiquinol oxidase subunit II [Nitrospirae bacterium]|nr:cytochrome d ubiquinol oxidase subunit II [Nitrospirota bacterium]